MEQAFNRFNDLVQSFPLYRGKGSRDTGETSEQSVGYFKGSFKAYPIPDSGSLLPELVFSNIPSDVLDPVDVVIRVYIIKVHVCYVVHFLPEYFYLYVAHACNLVIHVPDFSLLCLHSYT